MSIGWMIGCIVLDVIVIIANIIEQILIIRRWQNLDRIDHLLFSLSISDFANGIATLGIDAWFLAKSSILDMTPKMKRNHIIISYVFDSIFLFSVFASILHVIAVSIERLYAVRFPRKYYIFTTYKCKCITMLLIWSWSFVLTLIFTILSIHIFHRRLGEFIRGSVFMISIMIVLFMYLVISYFLLKQRKTIKEDFNPDFYFQQNRLKRLTVLCLFLGLSFVVCVLPITLSYFNQLLYHDFSNVMITLNSFINPCVYFSKVYYDSCYNSRIRSNTTNILIDANKDIDNTEDNEDQCKR